MRLQRSAEGTLSKVRNLLSMTPLFLGVFFLSALSAGGVAIADPEAEAPAGLAAALRAVMTNHPAVKARRAELDAKGHAIGTAKAERFPTLSGRANRQDDDFDQGTILLNQPLWAFGKINNAIKQAQADFEAEVWALRQVERTLIEDTAAAYSKVAGIRQRAAVAEANTGQHARLYQRIERRRKGKLASEADVRLAHSRLIQARARQERIDGELRVTLAELQALTQIRVSADRAVDLVHAELPSAPDVEVLALNSSANVRNKRMILEVVRLDIKKEEIASLPTLSIRAERDFRVNRNGIDDARIGLVIEGSVRGLGLVSRGRVKGAAARLDAAEHEIDAALNDVRRRVSTLMLNRQVQTRLKQFQGQALESIEATMASFLRQYETGRKSWLEVLNIQRELADLSLQLAQIRSDWLILSLRVAAVTGGLDELAGIENL